MEKINDPLERELIKGIIKSEHFSLDSMPIDEAYTKMYQYVINNIEKISKDNLIIIDILKGKSFLYGSYFIFRMKLDYIIFLLKNNDSYKKETEIFRN